MADRAVSPPWSVEEYNDACFIVRDRDGQQLAYVYFEDDSESLLANQLAKTDAELPSVHLQ